MKTGKPGVNERHEAFIERILQEFVAGNEGNRHQAPEDGPYFKEPLVGFADGEDPLFSQYKEIIGPYHFTPREVLEKAISEGLTPGRRGLKRISVIAYILPIPEETVRGNAQESRFPTRQWAHNRNFGEQFNVQLRQHLVETLEALGYAAIAPMSSKYFAVERSGDTPVASNWSERHACYASGLGTFSINDGFITSRGIAMRCGSVITNLELSPTPRPYASHTENCLFCRDGSCGACIQRCPAEAISEKGHDKARCANYIMTEVGPIYKPQYGVEITGCGLCQSGVPCQDRIP